MDQLSELPFLVRKVTSTIGKPFSKWPTDGLSFRRKSVTQSENHRNAREKGSLFSPGERLERRSYRRDDTMSVIYSSWK
jgi:hypothetical protein